MRQPPVIISLNAMYFSTKYFTYKYLKKLDWCILVEKGIITIASWSGSGQAQLKKDKNSQNIIAQENSVFSKLDGVARW